MLWASSTGAPVPRHLSVATLRIYKALIGVPVLVNNVPTWKLCVFDYYFFYCAHRHIDEMMLASYMQGIYCIGNCNRCECVVCVFLRFFPATSLKTTKLDKSATLMRTKKTLKILILEFNSTIEKLTYLLTLPTHTFSHIQRYNE